MSAGQRLALRRGTVASVESEGAVARATVEVDGELRPAVSYTALCGEIAPGDDVVVNVAARDLGLGSGGFDIVHVNLTRGLAGTGAAGAHVMKLNYTSLQHAVHPLEEQAAEVASPIDRPVAALALHGQLACVAWAAAQAAPGTRVGYVQTEGGALAGEFSDAVRELHRRGLLAGHVSAGAAHGGEYDAITPEGALHAGLTVLGWDAAIAGPGPGVLGSSTSLGHGGMAALHAVHAAQALGCRALVVPRMSSGDPRERHRGISHHTLTVLRLALRPVSVALPPGAPALPEGPHEPIEADVDLEGYLAAGLPALTMGRGPDEDELFFRAALAGGVALGEMIREQSASAEQD